MTGLVLSADGIDVEVLPDLGGKISRIYDTKRSREWLVPTPAGKGRAPHGSLFADAGMSGWDEMLPTIWPCDYPGDGRYHGAALPDHGELWTAGWDVLAATDREVTLSVETTILPVHLVRRAAVQESRLQLDYELTATSGEPVEVLWAAHPLFSCTSTTRVVLPGSVREMLDVIDPRNSQIVDWPGALDVVSAIPSGTGRKLYLEPAQTCSWAMLVDADGTSMIMRWDPEEVPYVGLWLDNGWLSDGPVAAIEPALAFCDELAMAHDMGRALTVHPAVTVGWSIAIELAHQSNPGADRQLGSTGHRP